MWKQQTTTSRTLENTSFSLSAADHISSTKRKEVQIYWKFGHHLCLPTQVCVSWSFIRHSQAWDALTIAHVDAATQIPSVPNLRPRMSLSIRLNMLVRWCHFTLRWHFHVCLLQMYGHKNVAMVTENNLSHLLIKLNVRPAASNVLSLDFKPFVLFKE